MLVFVMPLSKDAQVIYIFNPTSAKDIKLENDDEATSKYYISCIH